jgi:hypothetical protein
MDWITESLKQAPQSVAVIIVTYLLIQYFQKRDAASRAYDKEREERQMAASKSLNDEHIYQRQQSKESIDRNTSIMERNVSATDRNSFMIDTLSKTMQAMQEAMARMNQRK